MNKSPHSNAHEKFLKALKKKKIITLSAQIGILIFAIGLWELLVRVEVLDGFLFSSPTRMLRTIANLFKSGELFMHMGITLYECILGFAISTLLGTVIAVALWWSEYLRRILEPYIIVLNSLPKIALGPIIIVWVGIGTASIVTMTVLISIIVTVISVLNGFMNCDDEKIFLLRSMGANKLQIFFKLVLPNSIPDLIAALKINVGLSWVGTIMGEYLASRAGLGYLIVYGGQVFKLDLVMASTVLLCILAALMYVIVSLIEKRINKSR